MTNKKKLIMLIAVVVLLGTITTLLTFFLPKKDTSSEQADNYTVILNLNDKSIEEIHIKNTTSEFTLKRQEGGKFAIEGKEKFELESDTIDKLLAYVSQLASYKVVDKSDKNLSAYGLDKPTSVVTLKTLDGKTNTIKFGSSAPTKSGYYAILNDSKDVNLLAFDLGTIVTNPRYQFYKSQFGYYPDGTQPSTDLDYVILTAKDKPTVRIKRLDNVDQEGASASATSFWMQEPITMPLSIDATTKFTSVPANLKYYGVADDEVTDEDLKTYGLDNPRFTYEYSIKGKSCKILFGNDYAVSQTAYAMVEGVPIVYYFDLQGQDPFWMSIIEMVEKQVYLRDIRTVDTIEFTANGITNTLKSPGTSDDIPGKVNGKDVDPELFRDFYKNILSIKIVDEAKKPSGVKPIVSIKVNLLKGGYETLNFYPINDRQCYYEFQGTGRFYVDRSLVDRLISDFDKLCKGETIQSIW